MTKKLFVMLLLCSTITLILVACGTTQSGVSPKGNEVHMSSTDFTQSSITIKKGESITLIDDGLIPHTIANGTWKNGTAQPTREPDAPMVKDVQINGNGSANVGPFTAAGTFELYCTIHPGMNLKVVVQ